MSSWFYAKNGKRLGPFSTAQLEQLAAAGMLLPTDVVLQDGTQQWVPAGSVPTFFPPAVEQAAPVATSTEAEILTVLPAQPASGGPPNVLPATASAPAPSTLPTLETAAPPNPQPEQGTRPQSNPWSSWYYWLMLAACGFAFLTFQQQQRQRQAEKQRPNEQAQPSLYPSRYVVVVHENTSPAITLKRYLNKDCRSSTYTSDAIGSVNVAYFGSEQEAKEAADKWKAYQRSRGQSDGNPVVEKLASRKP